MSAPVREAGRASAPGGGRAGAVVRGAAVRGDRADRGGPGGRVAVVAGGADGARPGWVKVVAVGLAAAVAGLLFTPVFGLRGLVPPVAAAVVPPVAVAVAARRLDTWRSVLVALVGLVGVVLVLRPAGPLGLLAAAPGSWRETLRSTWPARPEPELLVFVPLLVLAAVVFGVELLHRVRAPLVAVLPAVAVLALSQAYDAADAVTGIVAAVVFAACAAVLVARRPPWLAVAVGVVGAVGLGAVAPGPAASLRGTAPAALENSRVASPLTELPARLARPGTPVFEYDAAAPVDRWPIAVLDRFDGVEWEPSGDLRRLGTGLPEPEGVTVATERHSARVRLRDLEGPWLPSRAWPASVTGAEPLVDPARGTLLSESPVTEYELAWWEPRVEPETLIGAAIDPHAPGGLDGVGVVPPEVSELADEAVHGRRPSFQTAVALERFLRDNYELVGEGALPVGHGWPQLERFLLEEKKGTTEQFAAAYVALARIRGIPARLVVGFGAGEDGVVRNGDAFAWPEVAVRGVGWVPMEPTGTARASTGLSGDAEDAREQLPPAEDLPEPKLPPPGSDVGAPEPGADWSWAVVGLVLGALVLGWLPVVPFAGVLRSWRRRRSGTVLDAWAEVRHRLRRHGVPVTPAMTVRDAARVAGPVTDQSTVDAMRELAVAVDATLWSGAPFDGRAQAWAAVRAVRAGLRRRPVKARLRAAFRW